MHKIKMLYLAGDVHRGGHDLHRIAQYNKKLFEASGAFEITMVADRPNYANSNDETLAPPDWADMTFAQLYAKIACLEKADVIFFHCNNNQFCMPEQRQALERAIAKGVGFVVQHGMHPCWWDGSWPEIEKMAGWMWRDKTSHGDYANARIRIDGEHPITEGLEDFDTRDEIFCGLENGWNVQSQTLASAYSDENVISRHGHPGTGKWEGVAMTGQYGRGRTFNYALGHVFPYYTGHGLGENTLLSFRPLPMRKMLVRGCEWAATGSVERTKDFDGYGK